MVQLSLRMRAETRSKGNVVRALQSLTREAQFERGFIDSRIYQNVDDPQSLCLEQDWASAAELESHIRSICFSKLLQIVETAVETPVLEVYIISAVRGLEYIDALRFRT
jgi:quinol monooxygenase YgiN